MFTFNQTQKIKDTATAKGLELWETIRLANNGEICVTKTDKLVAFYPDTVASEWLSVLSSDHLSALTLDNLFPWLDKYFGNFMNPEYTKMLEANPNYESNAAQMIIVSMANNYMPKTLADKLKQQAITQYFDNPQALTDEICEAITTNF